MDSDRRLSKRFKSILLWFCWNCQTIPVFLEKDSIWRKPWFRCEHFKSWNLEHPPAHEPTLCDEHWKVCQNWEKLENSAMSSRKNPWNLSSFERFMVICCWFFFFGIYTLVFLVGGQKNLGFVGWLSRQFLTTSLPSFCFPHPLKKSMLWKQTSQTLCNTCLGVGSSPVGFIYIYIYILEFLSLPSECLKHFQCIAMWACVQLRCR